MTGVNPLEEYFRNNDSRLIHKWMHYFEIYHRHFERFRGRPVVVLEFGVNQGGSLEMWRDYFGPNAKIFGVDIDPRCQQFEGDNIRILIGDQADKEFLKASGRRDRGPIDVVIEDGGHRMRQQKMTFRHIYPHMSDDGCFLTEDTHTSYWAAVRRRVPPARHLHASSPRTRSTSSTPGTRRPRSSRSTSSPAPPSPSTSTTASWSSSAASAPSPSTGSPAARRSGRCRDCPATRLTAQAWMRGPGIPDYVDPTRTHRRRTTMPEEPLSDDDMTTTPAGDAAAHG